MRQEKRLTIYMSLLFLIVMIVFGVTILNEEKSKILIPRVNDKLHSYLDNNYPELKNKVDTKKTIYKKDTYILKVFSKKNKNLYFYLKYKDKQTTSTYKTDYIEGKTLLTKISKDLKKEISKKLNYKVNIKINNKLNKFSKKVKQKILSEKNLTSLKIYDIYKDVEIDKLNTDNIYREIKKLKTDCDSKKITPKTYNFTITNKNDITESLEISNVSSDAIKSNDLKTIINDILNKNDSNILKKYNITYKYLN